MRDLRFDVFVTEAILKKKVCTCFLNFSRLESINHLRHNLENDLKVYFRGQVFYILEVKALKKTIQKRCIYTAYIDDVYIPPWPTECKTRDRIRNTFKTYIYVLGLQNEIGPAKSRVDQGRIYTSLAYKGLNLLKTFP